MGQDQVGRATLGDEGHTTALRDRAVGRQPRARPLVPAGGPVPQAGPPPLGLRCRAAPGSDVSMPDDTLELTLTRRLREVVDGAAATEGELRLLTEQAEGLARSLAAA